MQTKKIMILLPILLVLSFLSVKASNTECYVFAANCTPGGGYSPDAMSCCSCQLVWNDINGSSSCTNVNYWDSFKTLYFHKKTIEVSVKRQSTGEVITPTELANLVLQEQYNQYLNAKEAIRTQKVKDMRDSIFISLGYSQALLYIFFDLLKLIFFVIELVFITYIILKLIPSMFFRLRDSMVERYMMRNRR